VSRHHHLTLHQHQRIGPIAIGCFLERIGKLLSDLFQGRIVVRDVHLVAKNSTEVHLGQACGLLRRPLRPSTPGADFFPAVSQNSDLNLLFCCVLHTNSLFLFSIKMLG
jgi:hypothetical protein